jgi:hypothetical protein
VGKTKVMKMDTAELLQKITDVLGTWEGESIADKANVILDGTVVYLGDDVFEVTES